MIHATRPFVVNEWIQTKIEGYEVSGTVEVCMFVSNMHLKMKQLIRQIQVFRYKLMSCYIYV